MMHVINIDERGKLDNQDAVLRQLRSLRDCLPWNPARLRWCQWMLTIGYQ